MTKAEIRSLIFNHLQKQDKTAKYHARFLDAAIEKVISVMYWEMFAIEPHSIQRFTVPYGYTTPVTVSYENSTGIYYSTLPAGIVPLPDKASGVRRVATTSQGGIKFYPIDQREMDLMSGLSYFGDVTDRIGYVVTQTRVEYWEMTAAIAAVGVRMDILQKFSAYADTDTVLIPELSGETSGMFTERVLRTLALIQPTDLSEDTEVKQNNTRQ